jgi:hypothetical protein
MLSCKACNIELIPIFGRFRNQDMGWRVNLGEGIAMLQKIVVSLFLIALLSVGVKAKASPYEQLDQYAPKGVYAAYHPSPDFALDACIAASAVPSVMLVEFRVIKGALYAMSNENKAAKQKWETMKACQREAIGVYLCKSTIKIPKTFVIDQKIYFDGALQINSEIMARNGRTCLMQYK